MEGVQRQLRDPAIHDAGDVVAVHGPSAAAVRLGEPVVRDHSDLPTADYRVAASCPQAPSMSRPRVSRTVTGTPCASRRRTNSRSTGFGEASHWEPGVGL